MTHHRHCRHRGQSRATCPSPSPPEFRNTPTAQNVHRNRRNHRECAVPSPRHTATADPARIAVSSLVPLDSTSAGGGGTSLTISNATCILDDVHLGDSISVNGTCLTVTEFTSDTFKVGVAPETLRRTNLGELKVGMGVNLERAVAGHVRFGGHFVQVCRVRKGRWRVGGLMEGTIYRDTSTPPLRSSRRRQMGMRSPSGSTLKTPRCSRMWLKRGISLLTARV